MPEQRISGDLGAELAAFLGQEGAFRTECLAHAAQLDSEDTEQAAQRHKAEFGRALDDVAQAVVRELMPDLRRALREQGVAEHDRLTNDIRHMLYFIRDQVVADLIDYYSTEGDEDLVEGYKYAHRTMATVNRNIFASHYEDFAPLEEILATYAGMMKQKIEAAMEQYLAQTTDEELRVVRQLLVDKLDEKTSED